MGYKNPKDETLVMIEKEMEEVACDLICKGTQYPKWIIVRHRQPNHLMVIFEEIKINHHHLHFLDKI